MAASIRFFIKGPEFKNVDLREFREAMSDVARKFFDLVEDEFYGSFWRSPSGGKIPWAPARRNTGRRLLIKTGRLLRGSTGKSSEGTYSVARGSWAVKISVPYAYIHRGGTTLNPTGSYGVIPRRFATDNPEIRSYFAERIRRELLRRINGKN